MNSVQDSEQRTMNPGKQCCQDQDHKSGPSSTNISSSCLGDYVVGSEKDIELGDIRMEHIIFQVEGMDCSSCEYKLERALMALPRVSNVRTCLSLSRVEFDWYGSSCVDAVSRLIQSLGHSCFRLSPKKFVLDLTTTLPNPAIEHVEAKDVTVIQVHRSGVQVEYDPHILGARDFLKRIGPSFSLAPMQTTSQLEGHRRELRYSTKATIGAVLITLPVLLLEWTPLNIPKIRSAAVCLVLATVLQITIGGPFYARACKSLLFAHVLEVDMLVVISTTAAYALSVVSFVLQCLGRPLSSGSFFAASTLLLTVITIGRLVSTFARFSALKALSLKSAQPQIAIVTDATGVKDVKMDVRLLQFNDIFKVLPDSVIITDGIVLSGVSEVDESMMTGESRPIVKNPKATVIAGSRNISGTLLVRLTNLPDENTIKEITRMVDDAKFSKARIQDIADRVAGIFVPIVLVATLIVFVVWVIVGTKGRHDSVGQSLIRATLYAITLLIISCPCAIGLAVPMVVVVAGGLAANHGIIFKSTESMLRTRKATHMIFDKTGTITESNLSIKHERYLNQPQDKITSIMLGMTQTSHHPISRSLLVHLEAHTASPAEVEDVRSLPGKGLICRYQDETYRLGSPYWLDLESHPMVRFLLTQNLTVCCFASDKENLLSVFGLRSQIRESAVEVITTLQKRGIKVSLLSGDNCLVVEDTAVKLDIPGSCVRSLCSPAHKFDYVREASAQQGETTVFIGDGTNDAPALAAADIGIHIQSESDMTVAVAELPRLAADVVMIRADLRGLLKMSVLSSHAHWRIVFNFFWAFIYNLAAFILASGALDWKDVRIPPQYAPIGEIVSLLPVILIAIQLKWVKL